jgi:hypothetical protein
MIAHAAIATCFLTRNEEEKTFMLMMSGTIEIDSRHRIATGRHYYLMIAGLAEELI